MKRWQSTGWITCSTCSVIREPTVEVRYPMTAIGSGMPWMISLVAATLSTIATFTVEADRVATAPATTVTCAVDVGFQCARTAAFAPSRHASIAVCSWASDWPGGRTALG
jgi:hypothetical protein